VLPLRGWHFYDIQSEVCDWLLHCIPAVQRPRTTTSRIWGPGKRGFICPAYVLLTTVKWQFFNNLCCQTKVECVLKMENRGVGFLAKGCNSWRHTPANALPHHTLPNPPSIMQDAFYFVGPSAAVKFSWIYEHLRAGAIAKGSPIPPHHSQLFSRATLLA